VESQRESFGFVFVWEFLLGLFLSSMFVFLTVPSSLSDERSLFENFFFVGLN
jgi:hypothetical protein